jgi:hypothetical protein
VNKLYLRLATLTYRAGSRLLEIGYRHLDRRWSGPARRAGVWLLHKQHVPLALVKAPVAWIEGRWEAVT